MTLVALEADELAERGLGLQHLDAYEKTKGWFDQTVAWVIPTTGWYHAEVVDSWDRINWPMNQIHTWRLRVKGMEVGEAYNHLVKLCTDEEFCNKYYRPDAASLITGTRFIWTTEQDNVQPPNAVTGLLSAIYTCPDCEEDIGMRNGVRDPELLDAWECINGHHGYDVVSGLYFTKTMPPCPMAYGDPANGPDDFSPRSVKEAVRLGKTIPVNGTGMGSCLFRKDLFSKVSYPWFETIQSDSHTGQGGGTQDLTFARKAKEEANARFGVNCAVKVGHIDKTGRIW